MQKIRIPIAIFLQIIGVIALLLAITASVVLFVRIVVGVVAAALFVSGVLLLSKPKIFVWLIETLPLD